MKVYEVDLSIEGINKLKNKLNKIKKLSYDEQFIEYIEMKSFETLEKVTRERLNTNEGYEHIYRTSHNHEHNGNQITLWNDTLVDLNKLNLSEETRARYADGLSLAKIVEFGTGLVGANSAASSYADDWKYMVNPDRDYSKGWIYKDSNGNLRFTKGIEGKLVFYNTKREIENNIENWVLEYIDSKLGE